VRAAASRSPIPLATSRRALAGFLLSGVLFGFPGVILPVWGFHLRPNFDVVAQYFLAMNAGLLISVRLAGILLSRGTTSAIAIIACVVSFLGLIYLSFTGPPVDDFWRIWGFLALGTGAGLLNTSLLHAISHSYRLEPAATVNLAGMFFGSGALLIALLVAGTFNTYTAGSILFFAAMLPAFFAGSFARTGLPNAGATRRRSVAEVAREFTIPGAVLFSLLLFFHFGNQWAIAGWLPLYLIHRLGLSPKASLLTLAAYWLALLIGTLAAQAMLQKVHHGRLLFGSSFASALGCLVLALTNNLFGAAFGAILIGLGFAPIYPLVVERIGARFPHYHPGFFNGIFSVGLTGGLLATAFLGYAAETAGIRVVVILPLAGTVIVCLLVALIWLEARVNQWLSAQPEHRRL
jgi:fucose permease